MRSPLLLSAVVVGSRDAATTRIRDAFSAANAWITDVRFFSGVSTAFTFEAAREDLPRLGGALEAAGLAFDAASRRALLDAAGGDGEARGMLNVAFADGDPNLRHDVPKVPG
jgi:hypothetical protein